MKNKMIVIGALALAAAVCSPALSPADQLPNASEPILLARATVKLPATSAVIPPAGKSGAAVRFEAGRLPFSLRFGAVESNFSTMSAFVLPGSTLDISAIGGSGTFLAESGTGKLDAKDAKSWRWTAPKDHGDHEIRLRDTKGGATARLHVFVMHPYDGDDSIGKYRIGQYQSAAKDGDPAYRRPEGFIEVTAANVDTMLSPHFRLGQFVCKGGSSYPKYVALQTALLVKLETLIEALAERGLPASTLHVMSGYRTPAYNAGIGNETTYSRHTYGDAADVFLDRDGDGKHDDLNGDGRSTREDARILYDLVEEAIDDEPLAQFAGGLATYGPNSAHGPFIHIDTRGKKARW